VGIGKLGPGRYRIFISAASRAILVAVGVGAFDADPIGTVVDAHPNRPWPPEPPRTLPAAHRQAGHDPRPDRGGGAGRDRDAAPAGVARGQGAAKGARRRRPGRGPAAAARQDRLGSPSGRAPMGSPWEGSEPVGAERCLPSSKRGHRCSGIRAIGRAERWACDGGGRRHRRDGHAAVDLARPSPGAPPCGVPLERYRSLCGNGSSGRCSPWRGAWGRPASATPHGDADGQP